VDVHDDIVPAGGWPQLLLLDGRGLAATGRGRGSLLFARVVAPDNFVGQVEMRLGKHDALVLVENHSEILGRGDLGDDSLQALNDGLGRLVFLRGHVLLVALVGLLDFGHPFLQFGFLLANAVGRQQGAFLVQILDGRLDLVLLLVEFLLLLIENLL